MNANDDEIDPLGLSFTDVLTCVFGAAIVLFLIFIAIVVLNGTNGSNQGDSVGYSSKKMKSIQDEILAGFASSTLRIVAKGNNAEQVISLLNIDQFDDLSASSQLFGKEERFSNEVNGIKYHGKILSGKLPSKNMRVTVSGNDPILDTPIRLYATIIVGGIAKSVELVLSNHSINSKGTTLFTYGPRVDQFIRSVY